ncbi:MAG: hypothetical protein WAP23_00460, partial [Candidatus Spechtbacterales bacterium]
MGGEKYISLVEASKLCRYSQEYLSLRARSGKLRATKLGRSWFTTKEWLEEYVANAVEARPKFHARTRPQSVNGLPKISFNPGVLILILAALYGGYAYANSPISIETIAQKVSAGSTAQFTSMQERVSDLGSRADNALAEVSGLPARLAGGFVEISDYLYYSSAQSSRYVADSFGGFLKNDIAQLADTSTAGIFDGITAQFKSTNHKITSFFGNAYLKVVETVVPGYTPEGSPLQGPSSQFAEELEETKQELKELKEKGLVAKEITREVQRVTQIEPVREVTKEIIKVDDTKLLTIQGDVLKIQTDLSRVELDLASLQNSVNPNLTNSRL